MAERIKEFSKDRRGRPQTYPWKEWADGGIWRVTYGQDFNCSMNGFRSALHRWAERHQMTVTVRCVDDGVVEFQFKREVQA